MRPSQLPLVVLSLASTLLGGCSSGVKTLMPTPLVFTELDLDPVAHVPETQRFTPRRVYYATNRARTEELKSVQYSNSPSNEVAVGLSLISFGRPAMSWDELRLATRGVDRPDVVPLAVNGVVEAGEFDPELVPDHAPPPDAVGWWLNDLDDSIGDARDQDLLIYVHGAKVDFYNGCAYAAQLDHFMGRDMTSLAFCWPTHQNIFAYGMGTDLSRVDGAAASLASVLELIADNTRARRIHVLAWSAGARVVTEAIASLRDRYPEADSDELRERLRIRTLYFAAGDIPRTEFMEALPKLCDVSERVIVSVSSKDPALISAEFFMGGGTRLGQKSETTLTEEQVQRLAQLRGLEVLDVSEDAATRGFDITGHSYWYDNPWASTDVLLAIRTDLPPKERGLEQGKQPFLWYLPPDYPQRMYNLPRRPHLRDPG